MGSSIKQQDKGLKAKLNKVDASLPWRSSLEQCAVDMDGVQADVEMALIALNDKQRKFVLLVVSGSAQGNAYREAGYSVASQAIADSQGSILVRKPKVINAIQAARLWHQLKYGISALWKRQQLINLFTLCTTPGDEWNPNAANKSMQLLMALDGDIATASHKAGDGAGLRIVINTGVPERIGQDANVLDHDTD